MIIEYNRPETVEEALSLLARGEPKTVPLGGGISLNRPSREAVAVVDLQSLGLNSIQRSEKSLTVGATVTLQALLDSAELTLQTFKASSDLKRAIMLEATHNLRQTATIAGTLVAADGRSPITSALLALDAELTLRQAQGGALRPVAELVAEPVEAVEAQGGALRPVAELVAEPVEAVEAQGGALLPDNKTVALGNLLPLRAEQLHHRLITTVTLPANVRLSYQYVARTPADLPIVSVAVAAWPSGRLRVVLGGYGSAPLLAFDGNETAGADIAAESAYSQAGDAWASAEYRREMAKILTKRGIEEVEKKECI